MDSQWCLDSCPTCNTVVNGSSVYCTQCEPQKQASELSFSSYARAADDSRVTAWALDCYKSTRRGTHGSISTPSVFPSPCGQKLHLRKTSPTSWMSPEPSLAYSSSTVLSTPPISTPMAVESLRSNSTSSSSGSSVSRLARSLVSAASGSPTRLVAEKPNTHLSPNSNFTSDYYEWFVEPSDSSVPPSTGAHRSRTALNAAAGCCYCSPGREPNQQQQHRGRGDRPAQSSRRH